MDRDIGGPVDTPIKTYNTLLQFDDSLFNVRSLLLDNSFHGLQELNSVASKYTSLSHSEGHRCL